MDKSFKFKQFSVANERSAMKVGTDGVLLGAWVRLLGTERHILDVGTGTGVIALMLAQRTAETEASFAGAGDVSRSEPFSAREAKQQSTGERSSVTIIGIDIDGASAEEAAANFKASPWAGRMAAFPGDFRGLGGDPSHPLAFLAIGYDLVVSNPPFFLDSLKAPDPRRSDARHADSLRYRDLVVGADRNLAPDGRLALILPADNADGFVAEAESFGLHLCRRCRVSTVAGHAPSRALLELSRTPVTPFLEDTTLAIQDPSGFTTEYRALTGEFYLNF